MTNLNRGYKKAYQELSVPDREVVSMPVVKPGQSKRLQGIVITVAVLALVGVAVIMTRDNTGTNDVFTTPQSKSESENQSVTVAEKRGTPRPVRAYSLCLRRVPTF